MSEQVRVVLLPDVADHSPVRTDVVDVVVVGAGAAGFAAALTAAHAGAEVVMFEKGKRPGGTTRRSGGQYWIPGNSLQQAAGLSDDTDEAVRYMARLTFPTRFDAGSEKFGLPDDQLSLLRTFARRGAEAVDALAEAGALRSALSDLSRPYPRWGEPYQRDYHADLQETEVLGRHLNAASGQSGTDLITELTAAADQAGVPIRCGSRVVGLLVDGQPRVLGVVVDGPEGRIRVWARRGVVFGSGGFAHNPALTRRHLRGDIEGSCAAAGNTGDFQQLAMSLGAPLGNMGNAWWNQVALDEAIAEPWSPAAVWVPYGDAMIMVNRFGHRVVNEKALYNERSQVHFAWEPSRREFANRLLFMLFDHEVVKSDAMFDFRWPVPRPRERDRVVIQGDWWEDLAEKVDRRLRDHGDRIGNVRLDPGFLDQLLATVARFNAFCAAGRDDDFGRHRTSRLAWHTPDGARGEPDPLMRAFPEDGPFYCVILGLGALDTKGGAQTDDDARVLGADGRPIAGLYGAGNCVASPAGAAYWSAGATIGLALTFGYLAGLDVVKQPDSPLPATLDAESPGPVKETW